MKERVRLQPALKWLPMHAQVIKPFCWTLIFASRHVWFLQTRDKNYGSDRPSGGNNWPVTGLVWIIDVPNLTVIESGKVSPNPTALLQSKNFDNSASQRSVAIMTMSLSTAHLLGLVIDAAIIAQKWWYGRCRRGCWSCQTVRVKKVAEQLEQTGTPFLGVILNKYDVATEKIWSLW